MAKNKTSKRAPATEGDSRSALLGAAEQLFAEKGFSGTSIRDIARTSGLNLALISYYFGSKEQLFSALLDERVHFLDDHREERMAATKDPWERLAIVVENIVARLFHNRPMHRIIMQETTVPGSSPTCGTVRETLLRNQRRFMGILQEGIDHGAFRPVDTSLVALTVYGITSKYMQFREHLAILRKEKGGPKHHFGAADRKELENYLNDLLRRLLQPERTSGKKLKKKKAR